MLSAGLALKTFESSVFFFDLFFLNTAKSAASILFGLPASSAIFFVPHSS
jgi:hypothetical protein